TLLTFLFYMEFYGRAATAAFVYFLVNLAGTLLPAIGGRPELAGLGYLAAGIVASVIAYRVLHRLGRRLDRMVLARYSET
ncbi:exopolysaccharide Pel transporter PelG, partial [Salinispira pacifica]